MAKKKRTESSRGPRPRDEYSCEEIKQIASGLRTRASEMEEVSHAMAAIPIAKLRMDSRVSIHEAMQFFKDLHRNASQELDRKTPLEKRSFD